MNSFNLANINCERLKRMRVVRGIKQSHLADLIGVSQGTISKWETGALEPSDERLRQYDELFTACLDSQDEAWLKRLVENSMCAVHLMCEASHKLLVASPSRIKEWQRPVDEVASNPLSNNLPDDIASAEAEYTWTNNNCKSPLFFKVKTVGRTDGPYCIDPATMVWERLQLSGGEWVRLVTNIFDEEASGDILK